MEQVNNIANDLKGNIDQGFNKLKDNAQNFAGNLKDKMPDLKPESNDGFFSNSKEFLSSNTLVAKATFLLLVIILFVFLFYVLSRLIMFMLTPSESPYILHGMKDATQSMTISQTLNEKQSVPIYRSRNEYDGIEFTYSFWMHVNDVNYPNTGFKHVFHKGSTNNDSDKPDIFGPNNCPGVYLYTGKKNISDNLLEKYPLLGMLIRLNVYHDNDNSDEPYKYYDDIYVDGIPIKKWVGVVIRVTSQNIADVYINGTLTKRHKLSNVVKQNYDNIYINMNGGFSGNLSNLKYYNYAIGTFEIDNITSSGPNLKMAESSNIQKSKPYYLSSQWYFNDTDPLQN